VRKGKEKERDWRSPREEFSRGCFSKFQTMVIAKALCLLVACIVVLAAGNELEVVQNFKTALTTEVQLGVDLGTTLSVAAICYQGNVSVVRVEGQQLTPSVVHFPGKGSVHKKPKVGLGAQKFRGNSTGTVIYAAKRVIGVQFEDVLEAERAGLPKELVATSDGSAAFELETGKVIAPELVSAMVMKKLKMASERSAILDWFRRNLGFKFKSVTVSVPVTFDVDQKAATVKACRMAGFRQVRVVEEPVAAAYAYGLGREKKTSRALVFDIGGGTLDIALLHFNSFSGTFYIEATDGDKHLGGEDFDLALAETILEKVRDKALGKRMRNSPILWQKLLVRSERIKIELSSFSEASLCLSELESLETLTEPACITISREEFEAESKRLVDRAMAAVQRTMDDVRLPLDSQFDVVLVGGSSRIPALRNALATLLPNAELHFQGIDPDQAVAIGAAKSWGCGI